VKKHAQGFTCSTGSNPGILSRKCKALAPAALYFHCYGKRSLAIQKRNYFNMQRCWSLLQLTVIHFPPEITQQKSNDFLNISLCNRLTTNDPRKHHLLAAFFCYVTQT